MQVKTLLRDVLLIAVIAIIVNYIMRPPSELEYAARVKGDIDKRMEEAHQRIDATRTQLFDINQELQHINTLKDANTQQITVVRTKRNAANPLISRMSSDELTRALTARYADSLKQPEPGQPGDVEQAAGDMDAAGPDAGGQ